MNKLFTKVAALTLGVAMAAGVGVALGSSKKVESAFASDATVSWSDFNFSGTSVESNVTETASGAGFTLSSATKANGIAKSGTMTNTVAFSGSITKISIVGAKFSAETKGECTVYLGTSSGEKGTSIGSFTTSGDYEYNGSGSNTFVTLSLNKERTLKFTSFTVTYDGGSVTQYNVTDSVEHGSVSPSKVNEGATLTATITPDTGYNLPETVSVTMGGTAATNTYENGVVTVQNVTGDVEITGSCGAKPTPTHAGTEADPYTCQDAKYAIDISGTINEAYVSGIISRIDKYDSTHKSINYYISDDGTTSNEFYVYSGKNIGGADFSSETEIEVGASVVVKGKIKYYDTNQVYEFDYNNQIVTYTAPEKDEPSIAVTPATLELVVDSDAGSVVVTPNDKFTASPTITVKSAPACVELDEITPQQGGTVNVSFTGVSAGNGTVTLQATNGTQIAEASFDVKVYGNKGHVASNPYTCAEIISIMDTAVPSEKVYVSGIITSISKIGDKGGITYFISDDGTETNQFEVFYGNNIGNVPFEAVTDIEVGASVVNYGNVTIYSNVKEFANGSYLVSYQAPVPTAWTTEQENAFKANLDEFVPPFFGDVGSSFNAQDGVVSFDLAGNVKSTVDKYFTDNNWVKDGDSYRHVTVGGHGVVEGTAQTSGSTPQVVDKTTVTFTYYQYYVVTVVEGEHSTPNNVPSGDSFKLPSPTESYIPDGKQFKSWSISDQEYDIGYEFEVTAATTVTALYEDIPAQKYSVTYTAGDGTGDNYVVSDVEAGSSHTLVSFATAGFTAPTGKQFKGWQVGNDAELHDAGYEVTVNGDVTVTAIYEAGWSSEMLSAFETVLHGVIPSYDDSVAALEYVSSYSDFEMPFVATEEEALAELAILCNGWAFDSEYKEYSINTPDGLGVAVGWVYSESGSYSATIQFTQTHYPAALEAEMAQHMHGNIPPVLANGVDGFVYNEGADMFVTSGAYNISVLSKFQTFATNKGLVLFGSGTEKRPVAAASYSELEGTAYKYGGLCSDGGIIVVELFALTQYNALTINIYYLAQPLSIALSGEYKTEFEYGEQLDTTGMVVTATMSDETEQDVTSSAQFSGFDSLKEGEQTVTVTVDSVSTTYTVTVKEKVLQNIDVTSEPTKVVYKVGEEFDPEGLEVTATYNGGDPVVLDLADVEISGFDSSTAGEKTITVAFGGKTASFTVTVEQGYDADAFAKDLLDMVAPICANYDGKKNNKAALKTVWDTMSQRYSTLSNEEKAKVIAAAAKADGTDLEKAMAFYNYACKKYGLTKFIEGRQVKALVAEHETGNSILPIVVIVASSVAAITAIGVVIALKRRKALLAK